METIERNGTLDFKLSSASTPLRELAGDLALPVGIFHDKGKHYTTSKGRVSQKPASENYVWFDVGPVQTVAEANAGIARVLSGLQETGLAAVIASGEVKASLGVAAFRGEIDWEGGLSPELIAKAKAMHLQVGIEHYDRFTEEGAPLWVRL